jgi:hypothetical protein
MNPQTKKTETLSRAANGKTPDALSASAEETLEVRELSPLELSQVGGGGVKDHSI